MPTPAGIAPAPVPAQTNSGYNELVRELTSELYRRAPAGEKQERLWRAVVNHAYDTLPPVNVSAFLALLGVVRVRLMSQPFEVDADVRPERAKSFHRFGTCAKVRWIPEEGHGYTGLFQSGALGLARLSMTLSQKDYAPAVAIKLLVDGEASRNVLLDQSPDSQTSRDFFERLPTNVSLWPMRFPLRYAWHFVHFMLSKVAQVMYQPLHHVAAITSDGQSVASPRAPDRIFLDAPGRVHLFPDTTADFRTLLGQIPSGCLLYRVWAAPSKSDEMILIGSVITESGFVASEFGDRVLAMHHVRDVRAQRR
jgi:hypothetical protein